MAPNDVPQNHSAEQARSTLIPVQVNDVDRLNAIARSVDGLALIVGAAAASNPVFAAVDTFLRPIDDELQESKNWFNRAWEVATGNRDDDAALKG